MDTSACTVYTYNTYTATPVNSAFYNLWDRKLLNLAFSTPSDVVHLQPINFPETNNF